MMRRYIVPLIALGLIGFAGYSVYCTQRKEPILEPQTPPPSSPYPHTVAGAGIVEARQENVQVAPAIPGLVLEVYVEVGQHVRKGDPLLRVDDRHLRAQLAQARAQLKYAEAQLAKLEAMPRPEELPPAGAGARSDGWDYFATQRATWGIYSGVLSWGHASFRVRGYVPSSCAGRY